ncbi:LytR family transcriptional regulator [Corynebacterium sp. sy017]|uniref:LCP family protein n=1 Tax=unclassified Corynebacterium TaxID=2624378 RepID=UPI001184876F|nr:MULTISPECIES: LCP family protein [unclassified Corynebacterium]MBP3089451.1 LytR family transcriptional regulator [Corynebacterium sp. sy017]QDZ43372.1 LytR family transcriptional regulator [Corynebacterium sp. sy039]TSD90868.1 LytR family transcriptional regulator [Corynebacterium sp. SY003]
MSSHDEYLLDAQGNPVRDRFGRPVRRRPAANNTGNPTAAPVSPVSQPEPTRVEDFAHPQQSSWQAQGQHPQSPPQNQQRPQQYIPSPQVQQAQALQQSQLGHAPGGRRKAPRVRRRARGCLTAVLWLLIIGLVLSAASIIWFDTKLNRIEAQPAEHIADTAGTNWLLVGSDSRTGLSEEEAARLGTGGDIGSVRTDTIMVLHIPDNAEPTLMSIPRDSYVPIPGYGEDKINAAFTYGGAPLLIQTVEQTTGLRIDHYAEIGMGGLASVVDALGGIEICPNEPIDDPLAGITLDAVCQQADGPTALGYVRTRATALGDIDRVARQREFFAALVKKLTSPATALNPLRVFGTANNVAGSFTVDHDDHIWDLLKVGLAIRGGMRTVTIPYSGFADTESGNVLLWDEQQSQELFDSLRQ